MDFSCCFCKKVVRPRQEALQCDKCGEWQHRVCGTGIDRSVYRQMVKETLDMEFLCCLCQFAINEMDFNEIPEVPDFGFDRALDLEVTAHRDQFDEENEPPPFASTSSESISDSFDTSRQPSSEPLVPLESSIDDDEAIAEVNADEEADLSPVFKIVEEGTKRQKRKLTDSRGYTYNVKRKRKEKVDWQCTIRGKEKPCRATVVQDGTIFRPGAAEHTCKAAPGIGIAVNVHTELDLNFVPDDFLLSDIDVEGHRHLLFATPHQLSLLSNAKTWYLDGTFKVVRRPFIQLFSIHAFIRSGSDAKQVPLAFCLMTRRRTADYKQILNELLQSLPSTRLEKVVCDFEAATWKAIRSVFPGVVMQGCVFHWSQALNRKLSELGLQVAYREDARLHRFIRQVLALPHEDIGPAFRHLRMRVTDGAVISLLEYVESTWIDSSIWSPESWSIYLQPVRTNNDVEGWHRRLNMKAHDSKPPTYALFSLLHDEAELLPVQVQMVSEGKLRRRQRTKAKTTQCKLFALWDQYHNDEISTSVFLKKCGFLYSM